MLVERQHVTKVEVAHQAIYALPTIKFEEHKRFAKPQLSPSRGIFRGDFHKPKNELKHDPSTAELGGGR